MALWFIMGSDGSIYMRRLCKTKKKERETMNHSRYGSPNAYAAEAKARWGDTDAYREYEQTAAAKSDDEMQAAGDGLMQRLAVFGALQTHDVSDPAVQQQVQTVKDYITAHFYTCTDEILAGLGRLYTAGGDFTKNIDRAGGAGTAAFAGRAIAWYCQQTR